MGFDPTTLDDAAQAYISDLETKLAAATVEVPAIIDTDDLDPVVKARLDDNEATIAKQKAETEKVEKDLAKLRDEMATEKYTARAVELAPAFGEPDDDVSVADVLKTLATDSPEAFAKLDAMLDTTVSVIKASPMFKELGSTDADGNASDRIKAIAKDLREGDKDLTAAEARKMAWAENPDLVKQCREEQ